jgi:putative heme-binding domain-containing protein
VGEGGTRAREPGGEGGADPELRALVEKPGARAPDRARGREVFSRTCEQCHTLFGEGGKVGPDLTGSNRADLAYLLSNVVDPNAVVGKEYLATLAWLKDGRLVTGIQRSETATSISLQTQNELVVIAKDEIEESKLSDLSTMPEGLLDAMPEDEIVDLAGYLRGPAQSPMRATKGTSDASSTGSRSGAGARSRVLVGREREIVGRTSGLAKNTFLVPTSSRRLPPDARGAAREGRGQLRRSSDARARRRRGRGLPGGRRSAGGASSTRKTAARRPLADGPKEDPAVVKDGWNRYEIEAKGQRADVDQRQALRRPRGPKRRAARRRRAPAPLGGPTEVRFRTSGSR